MIRISLVCFFIFCLTSTLFAQSGDNLDTKTNEHFSKQLNQMDSLWVFRNTEKSGDVDNEISGEIDSTSMITELQQLEKEIPLEYSPLTLDFVRFYSVDHHHQSERLLGLSKSLLPVVENILNNKDLPQDLKYLPLVKSAFNPHFMSEKGASGPWQFMYSTGRLYELSIDSYLDERRNLVLSTKSAADMIKDLQKIYNDWRLILTAYNCGPSNLNRAIQRAGSHTDFNKIYQHLPVPERDLYPAFVAMIYIINHTEKLNLNTDIVKWPKATDTVQVDQKLHLGQVAEVLNLDLQKLKDLNPVYRRNVIPASYQKFNLKLPENVIDSFRLMKDSIYHYRDTFFFELKPKPDMTSEKTYANNKPNKPSGNHTAIYYTIKSGDNLGVISEWFDVSIRDLKYWNNIHGHIIRAGQRLLIYVPKGKADYYREYDNLSYKEKQHREGKNVTTTKKKTKPRETLKEGEYIIYTVKKGDNPWSIAKQFPGISNEEILRWNNIRARDLKPGQKLKIKKK